MAPEEVFTVRTYATRAPYDPTASAQIRTRNQTNPQVTALGDLRTRNGDKSQVLIIAKTIVAVLRHQGAYDMRGVMQERAGLRLGPSRIWTCVNRLAR